MEVCKLLVEYRADVNAQSNWCFARLLYVLLQAKARFLFFKNVVTLVFVSVERLRCFCLLGVATWKSASFWSNVMLT
jgi:hypothetical protein